MKARILRLIREQNMIPAGAHVLAGVSGGADSVALLLLLASLREELSFTLQAIHVEHGIRGEESLRDEAFTRALCERLGITCTTISVDVPQKARESGCGLEETARLLRYEAFCRVADSLPEEQIRIALAHHMDDNAETILFKLIRGSGLRGLSGMEAVHSDRKGHVYIRPLLGCRRWEIEDYLAACRQDYCTDSTNLEDDASRNRIRHHILPGLEEINSEATEHIAGAGARLQEIRDYMELQIAEAKRECAGYTGDGKRKLSAEALGRLHPAIAGPLLLDILEEVSGTRKDFTEAHTRALAALAEQQSGRRLMLPNGTLVVRSYDDMIFSRVGEECCKPAFSPVFVDLCAGEAKVEGLNRILYFKAMDFCGDMGKIPKNTYTKWFDYDKIKNGLVVRTRRSGDYLMLGQEGGRKKLKRYFTDEKIPAEERDMILLLAQGDEILWVIGGRIGDNYKVTPETKRILEVCCEAAEEGKNGFFSTV